jgi:hypothetical protein
MRLWLYHDHRLSSLPAMVLPLHRRRGLRHREDLLHKLHQAVFQLVLEVGLTLGARLSRSAVPPGDSPLDSTALQYREVSAQLCFSHLLLQQQLLMDRLLLVDQVTLRREWIPH